MYRPLDLTNFSYQPRFFATVNGINVPLTSISVEQTSYGIADTIKLTTPLFDAPVDFGQLSQVVKGAPIVVYGGYAESQNHFTVIQGILEDIDNDYDEDLITIHGRGLLANLVDAKISIKAKMNSTVTQVITELIQKYGLKAQVAQSSVTVGSIIKTDFVAITRNVRALDFIHMLCRQVGWTTRTVGGTVVVGPPPDVTRPLLHRSVVFSSDPKVGYFKSLKINHNALHNRQIKVKVVSYVQSTKQKSVASKQGPLSALLGLPIPGSTTTTAGFKGGLQSGTTSVGERTNVEEYVIPVSNKTQQECDDLAVALAEAIANHEFVATVKIILTLAEFQPIVESSPDFNMSISGCSQYSNNGTYFPKTITWDWSAETAVGLELTMECVNHVLPAPTGGLPNSSLTDLPT